jgi:hypothetical protein
VVPACGEIIKVLAPSVGYPKYHICLGPNAQGLFHFLFLNSENGYGGDCIFPCSAFPSIPPSETGESVVSFNMLPRFTAEKLALFGAQPSGKIDHAVAQQLKLHLATVKTLPRPERAMVAAALDSLLTPAPPPTM